MRIRAPTGRVAAAFEPFPSEAAQALESDLKAALTCEVDFSVQARALHATDASNYRQVPIGLVVPRTNEDVIDAVRLCRKHQAPILARGGGTSLSGQGCNVAVVIDFSKHLTRVLELDPQARRARVEPGCILDQLRSQAEEHHLTFGPDPATHSHNCIGGMIGNNSGGVHSVMAGRTSDNVERLTVLTYDGELLDVGPTSEAELNAIVGSGGRRGEIYRRLRDLSDRYAPHIEARYPDIPRRVSGYENLNWLLPRHEFNLAKALTGTEGTCVLVLGATLWLVPSPPCRALAVLGYSDIYAAADAVPDVLEFGPVGLEGFDNLLFKYVRKGHVEDSGLRLFPKGNGWLIVETGGDTRDEARANAEHVARKTVGLDRASIVSDAHEQEQIWAAREASLGATAFVPGEPPTWEGWEDSAVPRDRLGDYLRELKALIYAHGYEASFYGHFGDGVVHCRINFDLHSEEGLANWRSFLREAAQLVTSYGGSLSGEHGDGEARGELLEQMYGPELVQCFREFKAIWDPDNRMNPGKVIDPFPITANLRLGPGYSPKPLETHFGFEADHGSFAFAAMRCVGVGKCRRRDPGEEVMCPSYLVTGEEKHSTRGRAHLLHEMARGDLITDGWDSEEVEDALSLCLACKGCKSDCPVAVDVATYKAEFRAHHYQSKARPRSAYALSFIHRWSRIAERMPSIANALTRGTLLSPLTKRIGGIHADASLPAFATQSFRRWFSSRKTSPSAGERVVLWPDTFNNYFRPETLIAAVQVLEAGGFSVAMPARPLCCGRPLYDWGFLDHAKRLWADTLEALREEIAAGTPLIVLEPACASAFKDELPNLLPGREDAQRLSRQTSYFDDFVAENFDRFPRPRSGGQALLQPHCHHHAIVGVGKAMELYERLGLSVERPPQGCCGMAGAFGLAEETHDVAKAIGERVLLPRVRDCEGDTMILANGFSCREQIEQHSKRKTLHTAELLAQRML